MTAVPWLLIRKEFRALLPWWAATVGVIMLTPFVRSVHMIPAADRETFFAFGVWTYALGAVTLGAIAVGHELAHHTLSSLLQQPITRGRLLLAKAVPLAVLLTLMGVAANVALGFASLEGGFHGATFVSLPIIFGFCLTPWLTMVSRSALAGVVYSFLIPSLLSAAGTFLNAPKAALTPTALGLACVGIMLTVRTFRQLQDTAAARTEVDVIGWLDASPRRSTSSARRPAAWRLFTKELRLQQVTLWAGVTYVVAWVLIGAAAPWGREGLVVDLRYAATIVFAGLVSLLPGALVSAEERHFGTADWHALLPTQPGLQWGVKVGVALALSLGLAVGLPALLDVLSPGTRLEEAFAPSLALLLCLSAIYVSSLSTNGLHALLATVPVMGLVFLGWATLMFITSTLALPFADTIREWLQPLAHFSGGRSRMWTQLRMWIPYASICVLLLMLATRNQATVDHTRARAFRQGAWIVATAWGSSVFMFLVDMTRMLARR